MSNGSLFNGRFTRIEKLSDKRRFPRLGKVRLGVKVKHPTSGKEYPKEVPYFVVPPEVAKVFGEQPKELEVMLPINSVDAIFPQAYKFYGSSKGLKCIGNGVDATRANEQGMFEEQKCPCELLEQKKCSKRAHLMFLIPKVNLGGVYQIDIGSYNSIIDINSGLDYIQSIIGRFAMIPLKLKRVPRETHHDGKKQTHYTLQIQFEGNIDLLNNLRANNTKVLIDSKQNLLPLPIDENPELDAGATVIDADITDEEESPAKPEATQQAKPSEMSVREETEIRNRLAKAKTKLEELFPGQSVYTDVLGTNGFLNELEVIYAGKEKAEKLLAELTAKKPKKKK